MECKGINYFLKVAYAQTSKTSSPLGKTFKINRKIVLDKVYTTSNSFSYSRRMGSEKVFKFQM
jgi:hypothetical protein